MGTDGARYYLQKKNPWAMAKSVMVWSSSFFIVEPY